MSIRLLYQPGIALCVAPPIAELNRVKLPKSISGIRVLEISLVDYVRSSNFIMTFDQPTVNFIQQSDEFLTRAQEIYKPLDSSKRETRVIHILPSDFADDNIRITLQVISLDDSPKYESVSYSWEYTGETQTVILEGVPYKVTPNQRAALRRFRRCEETRVMWMDCLCINQADLDERRHQVRMMGHVYKKAHALQIWLGEHLNGSCQDQSVHDNELNEQDGFEETFRHYRKLPDLGFQLVYPEVSPDPSREPILLDFGLMKFGDRATAAFYALKALSRAKTSCPLPLDTLNQRENAFAWYRALSALRSVFNSSWWTRAWVFQEAILSLYNPKKPTVHLGAHQAPMDVFFTPGRFAYLNSGYTGLNIAAVIPFVADTIALHSLTNIRPCFGRYSSKGKLGWYECFDSTIFLRATDAHDSVYSFFGLLSPSDIGMTVDYSRPVRETFALVTWMALKSSDGARDHDMLLSASYLRAQDSFGLPSWCLNWSGMNIDDIMILPSRGPLLFFSTLSNVDFDLTALSDVMAGTLLVSAVEMDTVGEISVEVQQRATNAVVREQILAVYRDFLATKGIKLQQDDWRRLIFMETESEFGRDKGRLNQDVMNMIASWEAHTTCNELGCLVHQSVTNDFINSSKGRRMFVTESQHLGIGHFRMKKGDKLFRIIGYRGIYILRPVPFEGNVAGRSVADSTRETYQLIGNGYVSNWKDAIDSIGRRKIIRLV